jgi:signal transduction histidine kinase
MIMLPLLVTSHATAEAIESVHGLPFTRVYSFEEIGDITHAGRLTFDKFGRLAAIQDGAFVVLNDTTWMDIADRGTGPRILQSVQDTDGTIYFGALVSWGTMEVTPTGKLRPRSMVPKNPPQWVMATSFDEIICTTKGVFFGGWNGVVFWDRQKNEHAFFEVEGVARIFNIGEDVYVSSHVKGVRRIEVDRRTLIEAGYGSHVFDNAVVLSDGRLLASNTGRRLVLFDGHSPGVWSSPFGERLSGKALAMKKLVDGNIALSVAGTGLYVITESGEILASLTTPEYRRVTGLANNEPGVLWAVAETGVVKILYGSPIAVFGQPLDLLVAWPQVVRWRNQLVIASAGRVYEPGAGSAIAATRFHLMEEQPSGGTWAIAATDTDLLVGNAAGVFVRGESSSFTRVLSDIDVARMVVVDSNLCFAIGQNQIAALRWASGRWSECAPRVSGVGYPAVVHAAKRSAWIELGTDRAARLSLDGGKIQVRLFRSFPWNGPTWVNLSVVDDTVVLTGGERKRLFFDEVTETIRDAPELQAVLQQSPHWVSRMRKGQDGTLWASHDHGLIAFTPTADGYKIDSTSYNLLHERNPLIHILPGQEIWVSGNHSLYRLERRTDTTAKSNFTPVLVSVRDKRTNLELLNTRDWSAPLRPLHYGENSLEFRFFAGSYASRRSPSYQVRINAEEWSNIGVTSLLSVSDMREGRHRLEVRLVNSRQQPGEVSSFAFTIAPPWHRTWYAVAAYSSGAMLLIVGLARFFGLRTRARNRVLAELVEKRTEELTATMKKLNEETRNSATLAERQRLASEIHDSLQQGLSGLILQLDATLKLPELSPEVRSRLNVARSMVSFTRHEVQNAVWDMESPLLDGTDLSEALRRLTELIGAGAARVQIAVSGPPTKLGPSVNHHLLRIAQEAITNAVRHGEADTITISLHYDPSFVSLSIRDNGRGFDPAAVLANGIGHFGLRSLRARATKIGARPDIQSAPGQGTVITMFLPHPSSPSFAPHFNANGH